MQVYLCIFINWSYSVLCFIRVYYVDDDDNDDDDDDDTTSSGN